MALALSFLMISLIGVLSTEKPAEAVAVALAAGAGAAAGGPLSVEKTTIATLWANPAAKAVLLKELPPLEQYLDQIKDMTLAQVAPMSQGAIDDAKLKAIQVEFDKLGK